MAINPKLEAAGINMRALFANPYPGRGIIIGRSTDGNYAIIYWIMGRSAGSRSRIFKHDLGTDRIFTDLNTEDPVEREKIDKSLIIYDAILVNHGVIAVSNGAQTADALMGIINDKGLDDALRNWQYEPDKPNFTPRITGVLDLRDGSPTVDLSVLKKYPDSDMQARYSYSFPVEPGFGYLVTTYDSDGSPLPSFTGEPRLVPLVGNLTEIRETYWTEGLWANNNMVSMAMMSIDPNGSILDVKIDNKYPVLVKEPVLA